MSLQIDTRCISGIYAFNQWFKVVPNSFWIDAFELQHINEDCPFGNESDNRSQQDKDREGCCYRRQPHTDWYTLGDLYKDSQPPYTCFPLGDSNRVFVKPPQGCHGVGFTDANTGESVYFSLMECRAFRCVSEAAAINADPSLARPSFAGSTIKSRPQQPQP